jgi:oligoribonuclease NrnB/cAMP/cGMP phosphodiesterase (DHH superfamily)
MTDENKKDLLCIYHGNCTDGFAAAWAVRTSSEGALYEYVSAHYGASALPDVKGRHVVLVDFSYPRAQLLAMAEEALSVTVLDHHKTAQEDLAGFAPPPPYAQWCMLPERSGITALFDMSRSGAGIAWDFFHDMPRPLLIDYVEDRDLWRKQLPGTDELAIALRSYTLSFELMDKFAAVGGVAGLINEGASIYRYYRQQVEAAKKTAYETTVGGYPFWVANVPASLASDVAGELASEHEGFGATYYTVSSNTVAWSLRCVAGKDVSAIARTLGGGGHARAAGFSVRLT